MKMWVKLDRIGGINGSGIYFYQLRDVYEYTGRSVIMLYVKLRDSVIPNDYETYDRLRAEFRKWMGKHGIQDNHNTPSGSIVDSFSIVNEIVKDMPDNVKWEYSFMGWQKGPFDDIVTPADLGVVKPKTFADMKGTLSIYRCKWSDKKMFMKVLDGSVLDKFVEVEREQYEESKKRIERNKMTIPKLVCVDIQKGKIESISFKEYVGKIIVMSTDELTSERVKK